MCLYSNIPSLYSVVQCRQNIWIVESASCILGIRIYWYLAQFMTRTTFALFCFVLSLSHNFLFSHNEIHIIYSLYCSRDSRPIIRNEVNERWGQRNFFGFIARNFIDFCLLTQTHTHQTPKSLSKRFFMGMDINSMLSSVY